MTTYKFIITFNVSAAIKENLSPMMLEEQDLHQSTSAFHVLKIHGQSTDPKNAVDLHSQADASAVHTSLMTTEKCPLKQCLLLLILLV